MGRKRKYFDYENQLKLDLFCEPSLVELTGSNLNSQTDQASISFRPLKQLISLDNHSLQGVPTESFSMRNNTSEAKKTILYILKKWKQENSNERAINYYSAVKKFFEECRYDQNKLADAIKNVYRKNKWSDRNIWPKTALVNFLIWASRQNGKSFNIEMTWLWKHLREHNKCSAIAAEVKKIYATHKIGQKGRKPRDADVNSSILLIESMRLLLIMKHPDRFINSMLDITEDDAREVKEFIEGREVSILTLKTSDRATWSGQLCKLQFIFKSASQKNCGLKDIFFNCKPKKYKSKSRNRVFSKEEIEKLRSVDIDNYNNLNIDELFEIDLSNTVCSTLYEVALRAEDACTLAYEDIDNAERTAKNVIVIKIRNGKSRDEGDVDPVPFDFSRLEKDLIRWKEISVKYCRAKNIKPPTVQVDGKIFNLVFFNKKGKPLKTFDIMSITKKQCKKVSIILHKGEASHLFRHSRLTHLGRIGMPRELMKVFSRHNKIEMLDIYCHEDLNTTIDWIEKKCCTSADTTSPHPTHSLDNVKVYRLKDLEQKLKLGKTQCWERVILFEKAGLIYCSKNEKGEIEIPCLEFDQFYDNFIEINEATKVLKNSKNTSEKLRYAARTKKIEALKIGKLWFLKKNSFLDYLSHLT